MNSVQKTAKAQMQEIFSTDNRGLNFFRFFLGMVLICEVITKGLNLFDFYVDDGALPRSLIAIQQGRWEFSFHLFSGEWPFQAFLFSLQLICALFVLFNLRVKLFLFLSWILLISLQSRAPIILNAGDCLLRQLLFWSLFLPFSADKKGNQFNFALVGVKVQLIIMYFSTALLKDHPIWNQQFTAIYYALSLGQFTTSFGHTMLQFPGLLKCLTFCTYWLELLGPVILVLPKIGYWMRLPTVLGFISFHVGLILTMELGLFPYVCIMGWTLFLPDYFWNLLERVSFIVAAREKVDRQLSRTRAWIEKNPIRIFSQEKFLFEPFAYFKIVVLALAFFTFITWNLSYLWKKGFAVPEPLYTAGLFLRLDQKWNMFAPYPMKEDGWLVVPGELRNGKEMDIYSGREVNWDRPENLVAHYKNTQWRKYLTNVWHSSGNSSEQLEFGKYLCRQWNKPERHKYEEQVIRYKIYFMSVTTPELGAKNAPQKKLYWEHECFAKD